MTDRTPEHERAEGVMALVGRVVTVGGLTFTVTSASTYGDVAVWDPRSQTLLRFASRDVFENWAYGTPVPAAGEVVKWGGRGS